MKTNAVAIAATLLGAILAASPARSQEIASVPATEANRVKLARLPLDRLMDWDDRIRLVLGPGDLSRLRGLGVPFAIETAAWTVPRPPAAATVQGGLNGAYHSYLELEQELLGLERSHSSIARLVRLGTSLEGRMIYALKVSDRPDLDEGEPAVLILGCHHAREWISVEVPLLLARYLTEAYATDKTVRRLVDGTEIWVVPLVNPDGLEYSIQTYRWWRKNRRANPDGSFGVDLNRNYGYMWGVDNAGSSPDPGSDTYRGPQPYSEPETDLIRSLCLAREFRTVVSYHSYSQLILYPWGWTRAAAPQAAVCAALAGRMAALIRAVNGRDYIPEQASQMYFTNGDAVDFAAATLGIPAFTIELPPLDFIHGGFMNAEDDIQSVFAENLPALLYLIDAVCLGSAASNGSDAGRGRPDPPAFPPPLLRPGRK
jgi:carboxypeptidase T